MNLDHLIWEWLMARIRLEIIKKEVLCCVACMEIKPLIKLGKQKNHKNKYKLNKTIIDTIRQV